LGGTLLLAGVTPRSTSAATKLSIPPPPAALPRAWIDAPRILLWPRDPPGAASFKPQPRPAEWSPVFLSNVTKPDLRVFRPTRPNGQAVLVIPGGAYWFVSSANEGVDLAQRLTAKGITVFVLTYRLPGEGWTNRSDVPLQDAQRAMRVICANAVRYAIQPEAVSVLGFSAGGHLAATLATQHLEKMYAPVDAMDQELARPHSASLIYPVITMDAPWTHAVSRKLLLGDSPTEAEVERRSAERHVDANTPPAFLVHAFDDDAVPVENSLRFISAMRDAKRPVEAHLLQEGGHAFGTGYSGTPTEHWIELYSSWLSRLT
jgi:acetyl esterase/lipase